jgi:hypothetical protein
MKTFPPILALALIAITAQADDQHKQRAERKER